MRTSSASQRETDLSECFTPFDRKMHELAIVAVEQAVRYSQQRKIDSDAVKRQREASLYIQASTNVRNIFGCADMLRWNSFFDENPHARRSQLLSHPQSSRARTARKSGSHSRLAIANNKKKESLFVANISIVVETFCSKKQRQQRKSVASE